MAHFLRKTIGSWSAGTRVEVWEQYEGEETDMRKVTILAGDKPVMEIHKDDLVWRKSRVLEEEHEGAI